jgi:hypothetical protein
MNLASQIVNSGAARILEAATCRRLIRRQVERKTAEEVAIHGIADRGDSTFTGIAGSALRRRTSRWRATCCRGAGPTTGRGARR